jgi:phage-related protein
MSTDFAAKWAYKTADGADALYAFGWVVTVESVDDGEASAAIPSLALGIDGDADAPGTLEARTITIRGKIDADTPDDTRDAIDGLTLAFRTGRYGQFFKHSDRYCVAQVKALSVGTDDGLPLREWSALLRCADPLTYASSLQPSVALVAGANAIVPGGGYWTAPTITFTVTTPGDITVAASGRSFTLSPAAAGTFVVDCAAGTVMQGATSRIDRFSGQFLRLAPEGSSVVVTLSGGAAVSAISLQWRRCWL